jgi:hypothetical protein
MGSVRSIAESVAAIVDRGYIYLLLRLHFFDHGNLNPSED